MNNTWNSAHFCIKPKDIKDKKLRNSFHIDLIISPINMKLVIVLSAYALSIILIVHLPFTQGATYNGEYDIPAKDLSYLCSLIDQYKTTGVQPPLEDPMPIQPKERYMNSKTQCWKMVWSACSPSELGKTRPCGWYQMMADDAANCS